MSKNGSVDERIVQMQFNNSEFESKVAQTLESLTKLRENTKMEDAGKGLENLAKGVKQVDVQSLAAGIDALNNKFSAFGIIGQQVLRNLTDAAMNLGNTFANMVLSGPSGGMQTYESFTQATKQLMNSAKDINGLPVTLDAVNKALDKMNDYSDKTIYSFNDMTANIGKFTNAGVNLDDAVTAIMGISNVAASAGASTQNAAAAMYNFGQALGSGVVKNQDWRSIVNANMASVDFKNNLIKTAEALGTVKKIGDKYISTTYTGKKATEEAFDANSKFNESLSQSWMTSEVLIETLRDYASETSEVGKKAYQAATEVNTFSQMMSVFAESQKTSWSKVWRYIFGDYEESKQMWTGVLNSLNKVTAKFFDNLTGEENGIIRAWHDRGGRDDLIEAFKNIWIAAQHFLDPVKDLWDGLMDWEATDALLSFTANFRAFAEQLAAPFKEAEEKVEEIQNAVEEVTDSTERFQELVQEIIAGKWGNGEERIKRLEEAGYAFENLQNGVNETLDCTKRYETTVTDAEAASGKLTKAVGQQAEEQKNYREEIKKSNNEIFVHKGVVENLAYIMLGVGSAVKVVGKVTNLAVTSFKKLSGGVGPVKAALGAVLDILGNLGRHIYNFNDGLLAWLDKFETFGEAIDHARAALLDFFHTNAAGEKTFGVATKNLGELRTLLFTVIGALQNLKNRIVATSDKLSKFGDAEFLVDARIVLQQIGKYLGGMFMTTLNSLAGVLNKVIDAAVKVKDTLKENAWVNNIASAYESAKTAVTEFWNSMKGTPKDGDPEGLSGFLTSFGEGLNSVMNVLSSVAGKGFAAFLSVLNMLNARSKEFFQYLADKGVTDRVISIWTQFKTVFKEIPQIIDKFFASIKAGKLPALAELSGNLHYFVESLKQTAGGVKDYIGGVFLNLFTGLGNGITNLASLKLPESVQNFANKLAAAFGLVSDTTSDATQTIKDLIKNVIEKLKGIDIKNLAITGLIGSIAVFVARWSKVGKSGSNALKALTTFLKNGGKAAVDVKEKYNGFLKIGAAIALIAAAVWILGQVPAERFKACVATLAVAFVAMFAAITYLSKAKLDTDKLKGVGIAFAGIGAGVLLIAAAVKAFSQIMADPGAFAKGCAAVVVAVAGMVFAIKSAGKVSDGLGMAFIGLAAAVLILSVAVRSFAAIKPAALLKGGAAVTAFVFIMAAAMRIAGDVKAEGFTGLAAAVLILMVAVKSLGGMKTGKLVKGGIAVVALIAALAIASRSAKGVDGKAFEAMGKAIKALAAAMLIMSFIPTGKLIVISAALVAIFLSLKEAVKELKGIEPKDSAKIALALVALLLPIGVCLKLLADLPDTDSVLKVAIGVAAVLWALGESAPGIAALSKIDFSSGIKAIALADIFFASVAALLAGLGWLTENTGFGDAMVKGAETIGRAVHAFIEALIFGDSDPSEVLKSIGDALSGFGDKIGSFIDTITGLDSGVATNAKNLAAAILAICGAEVLEAIAGWIGGKSNIESFGQAIGGVTQAVMDINKALSDPNTEFKNQQVKQVISCVKGLVEIAQELPRQGGWLQRIIGTQDLGDFAKQMSNFIDNGFLYFLSSVNTLGDSITPAFVTRVLMIKTATKALVDLANDLPASTTGFSFAQLFTGKQDLGNFAMQMSEFMRNGFSDFVREVNLLPEFKPSRIKDEIVPATDSMLTLAKKLKDNSSLISFFTGKSDLSIFGSTLSAFGLGLSDFTAYTERIEPANITSITTAVEGLADLNAASKVRDDGLVLFSNALLNLGAGIKTFFTDTEAITPEYMSTIIDKLTGLHNLMLILAATDYSGVTGFTDAIGDMAENLSEMVSVLADTMVDSISGRFTDIYNVGVETAEKWCEGLTANTKNTIAGAAMVLQMLEGIGQTSKWIVESGSSTAESWDVSFYDYIGNVTAGIRFMNKVLKGITSKYQEFYNAGGSAALKFCSGLSTKYEGMINGAGLSLVNKALTAVKNKVGDFEDEGENAAEGFAKGIRDYAYKAADEARKMVEDAITAAKNAQQSASPSKKFRELGNYGGEGYGLGWVDMFDYVRRCVTGATNVGIYAMQDAVKKTRAMINEGFDYMPTITPVLDLSQLTDGMRTTRSLLSELNNTKTDVEAALSISSAHNSNLEQQKIRASRDYSGVLDRLLESTKDINKTAGKNRTAVIDGDYLFGYMNTRLGMA